MNFAGTLGSALMIWAWNMESIYPLLDNSGYSWF
jgi:hypothetical protein